MLDRKLNIIFLLLISNVIQSQTPQFYNYSTKDGLCNSNVYYIHQDKSGYIWFATDYGISRFDGHNFRNYFTEDGLNSNSFTSIVEGSDSTLYFANYDKGINIFKEFKFDKYEINYDKSFLIHSMLLKDDTIFIYSSTYLNYIVNHSLHTYLKSGNYNSSLAMFPESGVKDYKLYAFSNTSFNEMWLTTTEGILKLSDRDFSRVNINGLEDSVIYSIAVSKDKSIWLGGDGKIYNVANKKIINTIDLDNNICGKVYKLFSDSRDILWFHSLNKGLYLYKSDKIIDLGKRINLGNTPVTNIYEDSEGNVWVSTSGKGVFCFHHLAYAVYKIEDGLSNNFITSLGITEDGRKLIGTYDGLNIYNDKKFNRIVTKEETHLTNYIYEIKKGIKDDFIINSAYKIPNNFKKFENIKFVFSSSTTSCFESDSIFLSRHSSNAISYYNLNNNAKKYYYLENIFDNSDAAIKITEIEKGKDSTFWIGTNKGLCKKSGKTKTFFNEDSVLNSGINYVRLVNNDEVWVAGEKGIAIILSDKEKILSFQKINEFNLNSSTSLDFDKYGNIWVGNLKGLYKINKDSLINGNLSEISLLNEKNGLPVNDVRSIVYDKYNDELWVGTIQGLVKLDLNRTEELNRRPSKVIIEELILRDTVIRDFSEIVLKPHQNNFHMNFSAINYSSPKSVTYEYKFDNEEKDWNETENSSIEFSSLEGGEYNFLIRAKNLNNFKSVITSLKFTIKIPFWKTKIFRLSIYFISLLLIYITISKKIRFIKKRHKESLDRQNNISELRHKALLTSMNPHFIFNTLNSIQHYIYVHNKEEANEYLVNFARLIRMYLDSAGNTLIPLELELSRIKLYLKYENLRFEDKLKYYINIDKEIDTNKLLIPNMILQPFIENSIWHGLLPQSGKGLITIDIFQKEIIIEKQRFKSVIIKITDNGIGFNFSLKNKTSSHISKGIAIIRERLEILSPIKNNNFETINVSDRDDGISGTVVFITLIPPQYKMET